MTRHELESKEYQSNVKSMNKFFSDFRLTKAVKTIGFSDCFGNYGTYELTKEDDQILDEIKAEVIDYVSTFGGYAYIMKNDETIKEIELQ